LVLSQIRNVPPEPTGFREQAVYRGGTFNLTGVDDPERLLGEVIGAGYFPTLGIAAEVGRTFLPQEDEIAGRDFVAVINHSLWERRYGGDRGVIGKTITLDLKSYKVVGVLPAGFQGLSGPADVGMPAHTLGAQNLGQRWMHSWDQVAALKPGVGIEQAKSAVALLGSRIEEAHPDPVIKGSGAKARTLNEARIDPILRRSVLVLYGAVTFVLLIACVNIANLLLARSGARQREIAIRLSVGATRMRLMRQRLTESLLLGLLGAAASLVLAW
jgi:hypothetical protein